MRDQANLNRELRRFVVLPFPRFVLKRKQNPLPLSFPFHPQGREHSFLTTNGKVLANVNAFAVLFVSDSFSLARNEKQVSKLETRVTTSASVFFFLSFLSYVTAVFAKLRATAEDPHCGTVCFRIDELSDYLIVFSSLRIRKHASLSDQIAIVYNRECSIFGESSRGSILICLVYFETKTLKSFKLTLKNGHLRAV